MKKNKGGNQRSVNEDSFFATLQSVGEYWRAVKIGTKQHARIKGKGAVHRSKAPAGIVVVNPSNIRQGE